MTIFSVPNLGHVSNDFSERVNRNYPLDCRENKGVPEKIYTCFINFTKAFDFVDHNKMKKILKVMEIPDHLTCLLRNLYAGQEATVGIMDQWTGSKLGKEYVKAIYCHPAYLSYMQSTSCEMLGWMNHSWNQDFWEKCQSPLICR